MIVTMTAILPLVKIIQADPSHGENIASTNAKYITPVDEKTMSVVEPMRIFRIKLTIAQKHLGNTELAQSLHLLRMAVGLLHRQSQDCRIKYQGSERVCCLH